MPGSHWSPFSTPELQALDFRERCRQLRAWLGVGAIVQLIEIALLCALGCGVIIGFTMMAVGESVAFDPATARLIFWTMVALSAAATLLTLIWVVRSELTEYVLRRGLGLNSTYCVACGYDLRGSPIGAGSQCPECGQPRQQAAGPEGNT